MDAFQCRVHQRAKPLGKATLIEWCNQGVRKEGQHRDAIDAPADERSPRGLAEGQDAEVVLRAINTPQPSKAVATAVALALAVTEGVAGTRLTCGPIRDVPGQAAREEE